ncbi:MAG: SDR family oxidoreductase [Pseudomonadota bacterium]|nr:MAG: SDR family oxidoreductase [Pseudomonadota bacterium]
MTVPVTPPGHVLIVGCGDIGRRVANLWRGRGARVYGMVRSAASARALRAAGIEPVQADLDDAGTLATVPAAGALLYCFAPPPPHGIVDTRMENLLTAFQAAAPPARIVAISTSGVYGDRRGALVSEDDAPNPQTDRARRRLHGEQLLRAFGKAHGVPVVILRVGGIYGPRRLPLDRIRSGAPVLREELAPRTNRIHADDLASVCMAAAERGRADAIYNVTDGQDSNMTEYFFAVADACGLPRPPAVDWAEVESGSSAGMLSYLRESRRLDNRRMLDELNVRLRYPTLHAGLAACLAEAPHSDEGTP